MCSPKKAINCYANNIASGELVGIKVYDYSGSKVTKLLPITGLL